MSLAHPTQKIVHVFLSPIKIGQHYDQALLEGKKSRSYIKMCNLFFCINLKDRDFSGVLCKLRRSFNRLTLWRYIELACTGWWYSGGEQSIVQYSKFRFRVGEDTIFSAIGEGRHFEFIRLLGTLYCKLTFFHGNGNVSNLVSKNWQM